MYLRADCGLELDVALGLLCGLEFLHVRQPPYTLLTGFVNGVKSAMDDNRGHHKLTYSAPTLINNNNPLHVAYRWMGVAKQRMPRGTFIGPALDRTRVLRPAFVGVTSLGDLGDAAFGDLSYRPADCELLLFY